MFLLIGAFFCWVPGIVTESPHASPCVPDVKAAETSAEEGFGDDSDENGDVSPPQIDTNMEASVQEVDNGASATGVPSVLQLVRSLEVEFPEVPTTLEAPKSTTMSPSTAQPLPSEDPVSIGKTRGQRRKSEEEHHAMNISPNQPGDGRNKRRLLPARDVGADAMDVDAESSRRSSGLRRSTASREDAMKATEMDIDGTGPGAANRKIKKVVSLENAPGVQLTQPVTKQRRKMVKR